MSQEPFAKQERFRIRWMFLLFLVVVFFFWKVLFTNQFSLLLDYESANQAYAWYHFATATLQQGTLPLWDPFTFSGHTFVGEMQTGLFYPLKLVLYLWPLNRSNLFSPQLYHSFVVFAHLLAACFMFLLAREFGLTDFAAFVSAISFALGGFVGKIPWPNILDSAIWLPLILLFLMRALRTQTLSHHIAYAAFTGLALGMAILAGSLHVAIMDVVLIVSTIGWMALQSWLTSGRPLTWKNPLTRGMLVLAVTAIVAFAAAAIQLLPSLEYSALALRWVGEGGPLPATDKIPYARLSDTSRFAPHAVFAFFLGGADVGDAEVSNYFGVLPLLVGLIGMWQLWHNPWVKYLTGVAGLAFFYAMGSYSYLHRLLYILVPFLHMAREAGRFIYLTHFAMALLAGFGMQVLFAQNKHTQISSAGFARALKWTIAVVVPVVGILGLYGSLEINVWMFLSLAILAASTRLLVYIVRGHRTAVVKFLLVALMLCDLSAFHWGIGVKSRESKAGRNYLEQLLQSHDLATFFRSQTGRFRVYMAVPLAPNIGDLYGVQTIGGTGVTMLTDYFQHRQMPRSDQLLNVRYLVVRSEQTVGGTPVYRDAWWKVYENALYCPRAWVVYRVVVIEPSPQEVLRRLGERDFDPLQVALVNQPMLLAQPSEAQKPAEVTFDRYRGDLLELRVKVPQSGLLVLSEVDYPGWQATINGAPSPIYKVDGLLRGVVVPSGDSKVVLRYAPRWLFLGTGLTVCTFLGTGMLAAIVWLGRKTGPLSLQENQGREAP